MKINTTQTPRIIFFGTPEFAVPALEALVHAGYEVVAVVTQPDKPVGRGLKMEASPVKIAAEKLGLKVLQPSTLNVVARGLVPRPEAAHEVPRYDIELKNLNVDLGVCVAYGKIIPKTVLDIFPKGILNIHPSLLPKYRGPSPIQTAIKNGDKETGVTIMLLDAETDHGGILAQSPPLRLRGRKVPWGPRPFTGGREELRQTTGSELSKKLFQMGAELLIETTSAWLSGKIEPQPQNHAKATFTKMLEREDGKIDWNKPAEEIERMVRAYDLWPGTWSTWNSKRLKILRTTLLHPTIGCANNSTPGYVFLTDQTPSNSPSERVRNEVAFPPLLKGRLGGVLAVNCNPGSIIVEELQLEGKKTTTSVEFLHGYPKFLGNILS